MAKRIIKLVSAVSTKVNNDPDIGDLLKVVFVPDYNVSLAEILIPGAHLIWSAFGVASVISVTQQTLVCLMHRRIELVCCACMTCSRLVLTSQDPGLLLEGSIQVNLARDSNLFWGIFLGKHKIYPRVASGCGY